MAYELVVIGTSLGGIRALSTLLSGLSQDFCMPIAIVQHRGKDSDELLINFLQRHSRLPICEAQDKQAIVAGHVYLAPPDYHLLVEKGCFALSTEAPVSYARPSVDVLFESAAVAYKQNVIAVVLTGANRDGAQGAAQIKQRGGVVIVQDPNTCENSAMPNATIAATAINRILSIEEIAAFLNSCCQSED
ncbi:MAG: chemotaxis protein CheB [Acidobacteriota bacterium]